jgi:Leucine-rich repeat (LRR) protein
VQTEFHIFEHIADFKQLRDIDWYNCNQFTSQQEKENFDAWLVASGSRMKSINIRLSNHQDNYFENVQRYCPNLKRMTIKCNHHGIFDMSIVNITSLTTLTVKQNIPLPTFEALLNNCPRLTKLSFSIDTHDYENNIVDHLETIMRRQSSHRSLDVNVGPTTPRDNDCTVAVFKRNGLKLDVAFPVISSIK